MASDEPRARVYHRSDGPLMTKRSEAAHVDINKLMERYTRTGMMPQRGDEPRYGDFSSGLDFHASLTAVRQAESEYMDLPIQVRKRTENDPGKYLDLVMTPEGRKELLELGMPEAFVPPNAPEPAEAVVAAEAAPEVPEPTLPSKPS